MYRKGARFTSAGDVVTEILAGRYIFMGERPIHPGWMRGMTLSAIANQMLRGRLFSAVRIEK